MTVIRTTASRRCRAGTTCRTHPDRETFAFGVCGSALLFVASTVLGQSTYRLDRVSIDAAGGGVAESATYSLLVAFGQHDADVRSSSVTYDYAGGVFAQVPNDTLFQDGFEGD